MSLKIELFRLFIKTDLLTHWIVSKHIFILFTYSINSSYNFIFNYFSSSSTKTFSDSVHLQLRSLMLSFAPIMNVVFVIREPKTADSTTFQNFWTKTSCKFLVTWRTSKKWIKFLKCYTNLLPGPLMELVLAQCWILQKSSWNLTCQRSRKYALTTWVGSASMAPSAATCTSNQ